MKEQVGLAFWIIGKLVTFDFNVHELNERNLNYMQKLDDTQRYNQMHSKHEVSSTYC